MTCVRSDSVADRSMTDARVLLERHKPAPRLRLARGVLRRLRGDLDGFADERARARRRHGRSPSRRSSRSASSARTSTRTAPRRSPPTRSATPRATTRPTPPRCTASRHYRDRVHGHARRDAQGRLWLQYWLFYYYNDFQLLGPLFSGGKHEGDWELVQLRLGADEKPEQAVFSQHKTGARARPGSDVAQGAATRRSSTSRAARTPTTSRPARTGPASWFDQADGKGPQIVPDARRARRPPSPPGCCGRASGATPSRPPAAGLLEPDQPGPRARTGWTRRSSPARRPKQAPPPPAPPARPTVQRTARRHVVVRLRRRRPRRPRSSSRCARKGSDEPAVTKAFPLDGDRPGRGRAARRRPRLRRLDERRRRRRRGLRGRQGQVTDIASLFVWRKAGWSIAAITGEIDISNARAPRARDRRRARRRRRPASSSTSAASASSTAPACTCSTRSATRARAGRSRSSSPTTARRAASSTSAARGPRTWMHASRGRGGRRRPERSNPVLRMPAAIPVIVASSGERASSRPARTRRSSSTCRCESGSIHGLRCSRRRCSAGVSSSSRPWPVTVSTRSTTLSYSATQVGPEALARCPRRPSDR